MMKPGPLTLLLLFHVIAYSATAQSVEERMNKARPTCFDMLENAATILPEMYREKNYDSMHVAVNVWKKSCHNMPEIRYTEILLSISERKFAMPQYLDSSDIDLLKRYAAMLDLCNRHSGISEDLTSYYRFSSTWAKLLLENEQLDTNEKFICKVFSGEIQQPDKEIKQHKDTYTELNGLIKADFLMQRRMARSNVGFIAGTWFPTKNLASFGVHPQLGFQIGGKKIHHEIDLTLLFRFINTANPYYVKRSDSLYKRNYFLGGYIGLDYTYYFVAKPRVEIGWMAGAGYDGFDIAPTPNNFNNTYYLKPLTVSSLNVNSGLRINYYCTGSFYIGLQTRYNMMNYCNSGGTNLDGHAFSIDLIFGSSKRDFQ